MQYQIVKLYAELFKLNDALNNDILPLATHVGLVGEDRALYEAAEKLAAEIERHLGEYQIRIIQSAEQQP